MDEFQLIRYYFAALTPPRADLRLGIGDDAALLQPPPGEELAVTTDTLVAGRHFPPDTAAYDIGWKALAVNLSDLAAMGAQPRWFFLALTMPQADANWLQEFARGLGDLAGRYTVSLAGGDTTCGPLSITITAIGSVPPGLALRRDGARPDDLICVTGPLGDAALALQLLQSGNLQQQDAALRHRLDRPEPRVAAGLALRGLASAALDLSDGLAGDLQHILDACHVGAAVQAEALPASAEFLRHALPAEQKLRLQAAGGDDYELCLCIPERNLAAARAACAEQLTVIGHITAQAGLRWLTAAGDSLVDPLRGYQHFA